MFGSNLWYSLHPGDHIHNLATILHRYEEVVFDHWYFFDVIRVSQILQRWLEISVISYGTLFCVF